MKYPFIIIAATLLLSNCRSYFAHNVISNAKYEAYCDTADIKPKANQVIISDGKNYYMELPRYRWKQRSIDFMEGVGGKLRTGERLVAVPGEKDLYKLPANYARYLTGQSKIKPKEVVLEYVADQEAVRSRCKTELAVTRECDRGRAGQFTYTSPYAGLYKALGYPLYAADIPLSIAGNACMVGCIAIGGTIAIICYPIAACF